jgi:hypothetical protein
MDGRALRSEEAAPTGIQEALAKVSETEFMQ